MYESAALADFRDIHSRFSEACMFEAESALETPSAQGPAFFSCVPQRSIHDVTQLSASGELDVAAVEYLSLHLSDALVGSRLVVLDLRQVTFIDCAGLGAIVAAHRQARRNERQLMLVRSSGQVDRLVKLTGLEDQLSFVDVPQPVVSATAAAGRPIGH